MRRIYKFHNIKFSKQYFLINEQTFTKILTKIIYFQIQIQHKVLCPVCPNWGHINSLKAQVLKSDRIGPKFLHPTISEILSFCITKSEFFHKMCGSRELYNQHLIPSWIAQQLVSIFHFLASWKPKIEWFPFTKLKSIILISWILVIFPIMKYKFYKVQLL